MCASTTFRITFRMGAQGWLGRTAVWQDGHKAAGGWPGGLRSCGSKPMDNCRQEEGRSISLSPNMDLSQHGFGQALCKIRWLQIMLMMLLTMVVVVAVPMCCGLAPPPQVLLCSPRVRARPPALMQLS